MAKRSIRLATIVDGSTGESVAHPFGDSMGFTAAWRAWCNSHLDFEARGERLTMVDDDCAYAAPTGGNVARVEPAPSGFPFVTFTDFRSERCRVPIGGHHTLDTARRQFRRNWDCYHRSGFVWLESR